MALMIKCRSSQVRFSIRFKIKIFWKGNSTSLRPINCPTEIFLVPSFYLATYHRFKNPLRLFCPGASKVYYQDCNTHTHVHTHTDTHRHVHTFTYIPERQTDRQIYFSCSTHCWHFCLSVVFTAFVLRQLWVLSLCFCKGKVSLSLLEERWHMYYITGTTSLISSPSQPRVVQYCNTGDLGAPLTK